VIAITSLDGLVRLAFNLVEVDVSFPLVEPGHGDEEPLGAFSHLGRNLSYQALYFKSFFYELSIYILKARRQVCFGA